MINYDRLLPVIFSVGALCIVAGAYLTITHHPASIYFMAAGLLVNLVFVVLSVIEIWSTNRVASSHKAIWTMILVLFGSVGGLAYLLFGRRRNRAGHP